MLYFKVPTLKDYTSKIEDEDVYDEEGFGIETKPPVGFGGLMNGEASLILANSFQEGW